jgi:hypothetical protein
MIAKLKSLMPTKKSPTTNKRDLDGYVRLGETMPIAESKDFAVALESVRNEMQPSGFDWQYAVINKLTGIVEARSLSLSMSIIYMQSSQQMLDKVMTGELNGYAHPPAPPTHDEDMGDMGL